MEFEKNSTKFKGNIVYDGIVNLSEYKSTFPKKISVLKEANSYEDATWVFRDALKDIKNKSGRGIKYGLIDTFTSIIYTTYGILNNLK
jgi:hypothetical protein